MKAVVKKKKPLLSQKHRQERMDFAIRHNVHTAIGGRALIQPDSTVPAEQQAET